MTNFPLRAEVWIINWNPSRGSEQAGKRPALIIQNNIGNDKAATTIVAAISTSVKKYPMNVILDPPAGGLRERSMVKTSQILTISEKRLEKRLGIISSEKMAEVNAAIKLSLDIP